MIVHGDATGVDESFATAAKGLGVAVEAHPADWDRLGKKAGPMRNGEMVRAGADLCIAVHRFIFNSKGTKDCPARRSRPGYRPTSSTPRRRCRSGCSPMNLGWSDGGSPPTSTPLEPPHTIAQTDIAVGDILAIKGASSPRRLLNASRASESGLFDTKSCPATPTQRGRCVNRGVRNGRHASLRG